MEENPKNRNSQPLSENPQRLHQNQREDGMDFDESPLRYRAQSADFLLRNPQQVENYYHADEQNFFNRQRIVSDPRGLSVDRYVKSYQVDKGRKTKRFDHAANRIYHYNNLKRADFTFTSLAAALKDIDTEMSRYAREQKENIEAIIRKTAARKIAVWYSIMSPRRKLLKRLLHRNMMLDIVYSIVDQSYNIALIRHRRRKNMLRIGAAIKIQRNFKNWIKRMQEEEAKQEYEDRKQAVDYYLSLWIRAIKNGIRIFRYLRYLAKKKIIHNKLPTPISTPSRSRYAAIPGIHQSSPGGGNSGGNFSTPVSLVKVLENFINALVIHRRFDIKAQLQKNKLIRYDVNAADPAQRRAKIFREYGQAIILIQCAVRRYLHRRRFLLMKQNNAMVSRIAIFLSRTMRYRRRKRLELIHGAATKIQRFIRGIIIRRKIYLIVHAGLKLNFTWRKYVAYKSLKAQLRRVDRPYTIVLHGLRDLPKKFLTSDQIRFKISVWWNPLLHIVSKNDFNVILQSKQPQYIYISNQFKVMDVSAPQGHHDNSKSNNDDPNSAGESSQSSFHGSHSIIQYPTPLSKKTGKSKFGDFFKSSIGRISRPMLTQVAKDKKISPEEEAEQKKTDEGSNTPNRPRTGFLSAFNYGRKRGTNSNEFGHISEDKKIHPEKAPSQATPDSKKTTEPTKSESSNTDRPHHDTGISLPPSSSSSTPTSTSTSTTRKNSKKRSLRMSQNILPPSSLLQLALTEEDEDEDEEDEDEEAEEEVAKENDEAMKEDEDEEYDTNGKQKESSRSSANVTPIRRTTNITKRNNVTQSPFLSDSNNELNAPLTPPRGKERDKEKERESPRHRHQSPAKASSSVASNSDSEVESLDNFNVNARPSRSRTPSIFQSIQSAFTRNNSTDHGDDDGDTNTVSTNNEGRKRTSMLFSNLPSARSTRASVVRSTINFALKLRSMVQKTQANNVKLDCMCNFEETEVKIPGCHGNSVFKFEILEGE